MTLLQEQITASRPDKSIWLSASAGTGKTYVLVNRFLRLILEGNDPNRIVCITYTKAAAAEMQKRIIDNIGELILLSDLELKERLEKDFKESFDIKKIGKSKKKLASIIDFPEQLKIQTIHAFCQTILKSFPLEVGIPPFFNVIDDNQKQELIDESWNKLIMELSESENPDKRESEKAALSALLSRFQLFSIKTLFKSLIADREKLYDVIDSAGGVENYNNLLKEKLNVQNDNIIEIEAAFYTEIEEFLPKLADALSQGKATELKILQNLVNYLRTRKIEDIKIVFLTEKDTPRAKILNNELQKNYPLIQANISLWTEKVMEYANRIKDAEVYLITKSTLILFDSFYKIFDTRKKLKYLLDYDDLIHKTAELLDKNNINSQWVLYKLDGGIDHILLDEAQDTNPNQWKVVDAVISEFFSGSGTHEKQNRSLFVVGDEKQSIYSFQGADVNVFNRKKKYFENIKIETESVEFESLSLNRSFRSCKAILNVVDKVLQNEKVKISVSKLEDIGLHELDRADHFGYFEINELSGNDLKRDTNKEAISWKLPRDYIIEDEKKNKELVADSVVERIDEILNRNFILASTGKKPQPADIMILLKKRDDLSDLIIKKLQNKNIPVSGIDRLKLNDNLAIKDLIALGKFILMESDDLNFACLLKSPIFEISEDELFDICWNRGTLSVFENLEQKAKQNKRYQDILVKIEKIRFSASKNSVFEFYFNAIEVQDFRKDYISYFGTQINEILDEFLNVIKNYESNNNTALQQFIGWFEHSEIEIKRNLNNIEGEVRILTVHGAKGLEAPIVILPDTTSVGRNYTQYGFSNDGFFLCPMQKEYWNEYYNEISKNDKADEEAEYFRLLYVALTRPRDELYVFGYKTNRTKPDNWHNIIMRAASELAEKVGSKYIYSDKKYVGNNTGAEKEKSISAKNILHFKEYKEPKEIEFISPSSLYTVEGSQKFSLKNTDFTKGLAVHKLLEILPGIKNEKRDNIADIILKNYPELDDPERNNIKLEAYKVLDNNEFAFLFGTKSKAEVPICGLYDEKFISGKIDRLVEKDNEIIIIDYKTNRISEDRIAATALKFKPQLEAYKNLLGKIYKNKEIRTALLFTSINKLYYFN